MADDASTPPQAKTRQPAPAAPQRRLFTRAEFQAMIAAGVIEEGERVELLDGEIIHMAGEGGPHTTGTDTLASHLRKALGADCEVLTRSRLDLTDSTEVYPDLMVQLNGVVVERRNPETIPLIIETGVSSLIPDKRKKAPRYAAAGYRELWIYEPAARRVWVHREPTADGQWGLVFKREGEEAVSPLFAPDAAITLPIITDEA